MTQTDPPKPPIVITDYSPDWARRFTDLAAVFHAALGEHLVRVEHVGSTSVPGLAAKPILDIDLVIDRDEHLRGVLDLLAELGYAHRGDLGIAGREAFSREDATVPRDGSGREWPAHHLYVCDRESDELARHTAFRDELRARPGLVRRYGELKQRLAEEHGGDIDAYCSAKTAFICGVLAEVTPHLVEEAYRNNSGQSPDGV